MKNLALTATIIFCLLFVPLPLLADGDWQKDKADEDYNVVVYVRSPSDSPFIEGRAETEVTASLGALVSLIADTDSFPEWIHNVKSAKVLEQISDTERLTYTAQAIPWPVTDRDSVVYSKLAQDPDTKQVTIALEARPDAYPEQSGYVRVPEMRGRWELTPIGDNRVSVAYQILSNPGGRLPTRVANAHAADLPFYSLLGLHKMIEKPEYRDARVDIISEP